MAKEFRLAPLTESMIEGTISHWYKKVGDSVNTGEQLLDIETDKANVEVTSPHSGVLLKILFSEGEVAPVGAILAMIGESGEEVETSSQLDSGLTHKTEPGLGKHPLKERALSERIPISPVARRLAEEYNINLTGIRGSGPKSLITADDVKRIISSIDKKTPSQHKAQGTEVIIPMQGRRRVIAEKMVLSRQTAADVTTFTEVDMTEVMELRRQSGFTVTAYIVRAVVEGLKEFPILNSSLVDDNIIIKNTINMGIAVDLDEGLSVPVIHNVQDKDLNQIAHELAELTQKAETGKLSKDDLSDSTFTITNSGVLGASFFTPIINYPESAILGVGKIERKPVVINEEITIRSIMYLMTSYDHRIIDGASAVRFLQTVKKYLENPLP